MHSVAGNRGICTGLTFILIRGQKYGGKEDREVEECQDRCQGGDRIIGGSGLYSMGGLTNTREIRVRTPFGDPSEAIVLGTLEGKRVAFLARHGRGHRILPSEINYRANVYA